MIFIAASVLLFCAALGGILHGVAALRLRKHLSRCKTGPCGNAPVTFWRAVKTNTSGLAERIEELVLAAREGDQVLLGFDAGSSAADVCETIARRYPHRDITLVPCRPGCALNPKVGKFLQMAELAVHPRWVMTDSEAIMNRAWVEHLLSEWEATGVDVLTAGYRVVGAENFAALVDAAPVMTTLWPGLMLAGEPRHTLGACTALHAAHIAEIGGWESLADQLAEDHQLGQRLHRAGKSIKLSTAILALMADGMSWLDCLRHQHRVAVTYRCASPCGSLGLPILHTWPLLLLALGIMPTLWPWCLSVALLRLLALRSVAARLGSPLHVAQVLGPFLETACWLASWLSRRVYWAERWRRVGWRGRLEEEEIDHPHE